MAFAARNATWLDGLGEWSWPGVPAPPLVPAAWVPALPVPIVPAARLAPARRVRRRTLARPLRLARLVLLLAVAGTTFAISSAILRPAAAAPAGAATPVRLVAGLYGPFAAPAAALAAEAGPGYGVFARPPAAAPLSTDAAGSTIAAISYPSRALGWRDTYLVYLPPGYHSSGARRYPVLYLLHGDGQPASSFLRLGLQPALDRLIRAHAIAPLIAVMLQAGGLPNNWRNTAGPRYESYVAEVQRLTDGTLRTIPDRASRGIAGYSMGGFGAMNIALAQLRSYSVVESWEGFFNNLSRELAADRPLLARLPLHAFVWGGTADRTASPAEDDPWAAAMRSAGAKAQSALYPGGHTFTPLQQHLTAMLTFAGRLLRS